jgi:hypothetical protein
LTVEFFADPRPRCAFPASDGGDVFVAEKAVEHLRTVSKAHRKHIQSVPMNRPVSITCFDNSFGLIYVVTVPHVAEILSGIF